MCPTESRRDRLGLAPWIIENVEAAIGVGLEDASEALQMFCWMLAAAVARGVVEGARRRLAAKGPVVADIDPDAPGDRPARCPDRKSVVWGKRGAVRVET